MNGYLRQSTASQVRTIGPFVDDTDFKSLENALTIANTDIKIKKNGAASANKNSGGATADGSGGLYAVTWDATDTATVGELSVSVKVAGSLVYFCTYTVLTAAAYDATFASTATGYVADQAVNVTKWAGNTTTTGDIAIKTTLAKTTHITGFNDISTANVQTELTTYGALKPTVAARTLDVTTTGEAGIDWANIGAPTTTQGLTNTTISATQTVGDLTSIADAVLKRDFSAVSGESARSLLNAARFLRNKFSVAGTTLTVTKEDDSTIAWTSTVTTDAAAEPITGSDPA